MPTLTIPCPVGQVSDGYHTFDELYEHRCALFLGLMKCNFGVSWISLLHDDGSSFDGWFIAGMNIAGGDVTYHLPIRLWELAKRTGATVMDRSPKWDGHTSNDVVNRLKSSI